MSLASLRRAIRSRASPARKAINLRFFRTGPGDYGEGDVFVGLAVPQVRQLLREFPDLPARDVEALVRSRVHEERLLGLLYWVDRYQKGSAGEKGRIFRDFLRHRRHVNNWDLVDGIVEHIVGRHLEARPKRLLYRWAKSRVLWERRMSILSTFCYIKRGRFAETIRIARMLLRDGHDLMHKAVGWMLREVGKRDVRVLRGFLARHARAMPRTMLRYAIERFPEPERRAWLRSGV